jgi:hypothetical protein
MGLYDLIYHGVQNYDNMGVRHFDAGGDVTVTTGSNPAATGATETTVSNWAAPIVGGVIQRGLEIAGQPYQAYGGAQVAGASDLQNNAFTGIQTLTQPNASQNNAATNMQDVYKTAATQPAYTGTTFTSNTTGINDRFGQDDLTHYMNPFLSTILNPQLAEAKRQSDIQNMKNQANLIKSGGFGGGGGNLLAAENLRNLGTNLANITGKGYEKAYDTSLAQYNADQNRLLKALEDKEQSGQFGSKQGLDYLKLAGDTAQNQGTFGNQEQRLGLTANRQEADLGAVQRDIAQQGLTSDYNTWKEQRDYPKQQLDWFNSLLSKYPMTTTNTYGQAGNTAASTLGGLISALSAYDILSGNKKSS